MDHCIYLLWQYFEKHWPVAVLGLDPHSDNFKDWSDNYRTESRRTDWNDQENERFGWLHLVVSVCREPQSAHDWLDLQGDISSPTVSAPDGDGENVLIIISKSFLELIVWVVYRVVVAFQYWVENHLHFRILCYLKRVLLQVLLHWHRVFALLERVSQYVKLRLRLHRVDVLRKWRSVRPTWTLSCYFDILDRSDLNLLFYLFDILGLE